KTISLLKWTVGFSFPTTFLLKLLTLVSWISSWLPTCWSALRSKLSNRPLKKGLSQTIRSLSTPPILKLVTRHLQNKKKKSQRRRNAGENPKLNEINGFKNKQKKKRIGRFTTRKSKRN